MVSASGKFWIIFTVVAIIADYILNRWRGATLSEHCRIVFTGFFGAIVLAYTEIAFFIHIIFHVNVWPLAIALVPITLLIHRRGKVFRWDKWLQGAFFSALVIVAPVATAVTLDGVITWKEIGALIIAFGGGIGMYIKDHPLPDEPAINLHK